MDELGSIFDNCEDTESQQMDLNKSYDMGAKDEYEDKAFAA